jgi:hypothetical protein
MSLIEALASQQRAELGLRALKRGVEKARRPKVIALEDLENASEALVASGFARSESPDPSAWRATFEADPNLGLAVVRAEIEKGLRALAIASGKVVGERGILDLLWNGELLPEPQNQPMANLLHLLNAAVHGAEAKPETAEWAASSGLAIAAAIARL